MQGRCRAEESMQVRELILFSWQLGEHWLTSETPFGIHRTVWSCHRLVLSIAFSPIYRGFLQNWGFQCWPYAQSADEIQELSRGLEVGELSAWIYTASSPSRCFINGLQGRFKSATGYGVLPKLVPPARVLWVLIPIDLIPSVDGDDGYHGDDTRA